MAQFGKHLFGTSFFGKTSTFDGEYETEIIDAGKPFDGKVRVEIDAHLPVKRYHGNDRQLELTNNQWTIQGTTARATASGRTVRFLVCGSDFTIRATGSGTVTFKHILDETEESHTFTNQFSVTKDYADYLLTITTTSSTFTLEYIDVRVANVGIEVRAANRLADEINFIPDWQSYNKVILSYNSTSGKWEGDTRELRNKQYIQLKLHLSTSESTESPVIDGLHFSSGDLSEHAESGRWYASLNMRNIARGVGKNFSRVKRVRWIEREQENSTLTIRSASVSGNQTGHPTRGDILNNSYWKAETAPYILKHLTPGSFGVPWTRISLAEQHNGFAQSSNQTSVMIGPINVRQANLTNTKLVDWLNWDDLSYYPTNSRGTRIVYELFKNRDDIERGFAPIFRVTNPETVRDRIINLAREDRTDTLFLRIQLERTSGRGSPVVDYVDINAQMHYESSASTARYTHKLSPLDGILEYGEEGRGRKELRTIESSIFDWPQLNQPLPVNNENILKNDRQIRMNYTPRYLNQVSIGLGESLNETDRFKANTSRSWKVFSQTEALTPSASTQAVDRNQLYWHASYDGGTVNYPITTERDLSTDFTPRLLERKEYRFHIVNGWQNELFRLPTSMTWGEVEDITGHRKEAILEENGAVKEYNGRIPMGYTLTLPNTSLNPKVTYAFSGTNTVITEQSLWNNKQNDRIKAWIPDGGEYEYREWVSDELIFDGIINANDRLVPYVRTQSSVMNARRDSLYTVVGESETAYDIAKQFAVHVQDLRVRNNNKDSFSQGEEVIIPGTFTLPTLEPGLIYEGDNPYVIEIIPGSIHKVNDSRRLPDDAVHPGSDDEPGVQYTLVDSPAVTGRLTRGSIQNGADIIPFTDTRQVIRVVDEDGVVYNPYSRSGSSQMGDYILKDNRIDWSPTHSGSKEPATGKEYDVTVIHGIVNTMRLIYSSDYTEKMAVDRLWRSTESVEIEGVVTPDEDFIAQLPAKSSFRGYTPQLTKAEYVVEDNDIWVQTSIEEIDEEEVLFATLNGEDPNRNWYPTIQTGFYYINDKEYYLYSEPRKYRFEERDVPIIEGVDYTDDGLMLS